MTPKELINTWVSHFNNHDAIAFSAMYHPHAINHQVAQEALEGKAAIEDLFQRGYRDKLSFLRMHNLPLPAK